MMYVKIKGESDWVPAGIKNDGTLSIAKDTFIIEEIFTIKTLSDGNGEFSIIIQKEKCDTENYWKTVLMYLR